SSPTQTPQRITSINAPWHVWQPRQPHQPAVRISYLIRRQARPGRLSRGTLAGFNLPRGALPTMMTQVRIYTINRGMLDSWIRHFNDNIVPTSARYGVHVVGAWVNRSQNEFIWVRTVQDEAQLNSY